MRDNFVLSGRTDKSAMMCERCQGNGEIVVDWDAYLHPVDLAAEECSVAECTDCDGEGVAIPQAHGKADL